LFPSPPMFFVSVDCRRLRVSVSYLVSTLTRGSQVLILKDLAPGSERRSIGKKRERLRPPPITKEYYDEGNIKGQGKVGGRGNARIWATEQQENKHVADFIRKLDKETLNVYTPLRAGLGTREPSWTGLVLNRLGPEHRIEWMEAVRHEQDYRN
jgi:hypothetical protein